MRPSLVNLTACVATMLSLELAGCAFAADAGTVERGRYIATASDCEACHTAPGGKRFSGGLPIESPLGTIYATNITPSKQFGMGRYSLAQFTDVLRHGIRGDGAHLYPAMPYASYARLTDDDIRDLYAYMMADVAPVDEKPPKETALPFPYNMRFSMIFWNALFLDSKPFAPDPSHSVEWNRGKYLVDGPAHCGECHTPRGLFMEQNKSRQFGGAIIGSWYSPNITPDPVAGTGAMTDDEFIEYLEHGRVAGKAQAGGEMALAVQLSFSQLNDADNRAIVTYMRSMPAIPEPGAKPKFKQGYKTTDVAAFRGVGATSTGPMPGGPAQLFAANCASCHGSSGEGSRDGYYPSLFHNSALATGKGRNLVAAILFGINRRTADGLAFMPGFGGKPSDIAALSNADVAALGNYLLQEYGDPSFNITPDLVQAVRESQAPEPPLKLMVTAGEWAGGAFVVLLLPWFAVRRYQRSDPRRQT